MNRREMYVRQMSVIQRAEADNEGDKAMRAKHPDVIETNFREFWRKNKKTTAIGLIRSNIESIRRLTKEIEK